MRGLANRINLTKDLNPYKPWLEEGNKDFNMEVNIMEVNIQNLIDDARCYEAVRDLRCPENPHGPLPERLLF